MKHKFPSVQIIIGIFSIISLTSECIPLGSGHLFLGMVSPFAFAQTALDTDTEENPQIKLATVVLQNKTLKEVQEIKKFITDSGGKVLTFLPPNVLRVKITEEIGNELLKNSLVEDVSLETVKEGKYRNHSAKTRESIRLNNQIQAERKNIKELDLKRRQEKTPSPKEQLRDSVRPPPESKLSPEERAANKEHYKENWKKNRKQIKKQILENLGLEYNAEDDSEDQSNKKK